MRTPYLLVLYKIKTGFSSLALHSFLPLTLGEISAYPLHHAYNYQLPFSKRSLVHNAFFYKTPLLWNSLPQYIKLSSSFAAFKNGITHFHHGKEHNTWHLHGSKPPTTSVHCMFRPGHSSLNNNMNSFRCCSCGFTETLEHLLLHLPFNFATYFSQR